MKHTLNSTDRTLYPWPVMQVGDYFDVPEGWFGAVASAAYAWSKREGGACGFRTVRLPCGTIARCIRVW